MSRGYDSSHMSLDGSDGVALMMDSSKRQSATRAAVVAKADKYIAEQVQRLYGTTPQDWTWAAAALAQTASKMKDGAEVPQQMPPVNLLTAGPANDHNPKRAEGRKKPCAHYIPPAAILEEARVMELGGRKYGEFNWQDKPVDASTYYDAIMRHLMLWFTGEDTDAESKAHHLAHVRACCGIMIDAHVAGTLIDDRPKKAGKASDVIAAHVAAAA